MSEPLSGKELDELPEQPELEAEFIDEDEATIISEPDIVDPHSGTKSISKTFTGNNPTIRDKDIAAWKKKNRVVRVDHSSQAPDHTGTMEVTIHAQALPKKPHA